MTLVNVKSEPKDSLAIGAQDDTRDSSITRTAVRAAVPAISQQLETSTEGRPVNPILTSGVSQDQKLADRPVPQAGWGGWWTKSRGEGTANFVAPTVVAQASDVNSQDPTSSSIPGRAESPLTSASAPEATGEAKPTVAVEGQESDAQNNDDAQQPQTQKSWFGLWSTSQNQAAQQKESPATRPDEENPDSSTVDSPKNETGVDTSTGPARTSWAYWSKASFVGTAGDADLSNAKIDEEIAVAGTVSQSQPAPAQLASSDAESRTSSPPRHSTDKTTYKKGKVDSSSTSSNKSADPQSSSVGPIPATSDSAAKPATSSITTAAQINKAPEDGTNLLLPDFDQTYHVEDSQTYMQQLVKVLYHREPPKQERHTSLVPVPRKIRKVLAIGVHGYFPIPLLQKGKSWMPRKHERVINIECGAVLGPPTGTSIRFAIGAAKAIEAWTRSHNQLCEVEKIALEGEGLVADRVDTLWKLLLKWIDQIRQADFIMFACHSQGVPVTMMLIAKLLQFDCISSNSKFTHALWV